MCRYQSFEPGTLLAAESFIRRHSRYDFDTAGTWFQFGIRRRQDDRMIGDVGVRFLPDDPRQVEIGFTLSPAFQRQGYAAEAVTGLLDHLFRECGKHRAIASIDPRNEASIRLVERLGMRREAHFRRSLWFKGEWVDDLVFGMLNEEWTGARGGD